MDDDSLVRNFTITALSYCVNREVVSFTDGSHAWEYFMSGGEADIIISDVDMPEMNGIELITKVKEKYPDQIFIIMSGVHENESRSREAGANAFLAKPFEVNDLFNLIQHYVIG